MDKEEVYSRESSDSFPGAPQCPLCFVRQPPGDKQTRIIHATASERQHIACTVCLKRMMTKCGGNRLQCPHCREMVEIKEPIEELPLFDGDDQPNSIDETTKLKQIAETKRDYVCTWCNAPALARCDNCRFYLCQDCKKHHEKRKHTVRDLSSLSEEEKMNFQDVVLCAEHELAVEMYCSKCETACCLKCEEHMEHGYVKLKKVLEEKAALMKGDGSFVLGKKVQLAKDISELKKMKEKVLKGKRESNEAIEETVSRIRRNLELQKSNLKDRISNGNDNLVTSIDDEIRRREEILAISDQVQKNFDPKQVLSETKQLELYQKIEKAHESLNTTVPEVKASSETDHEGYFFQPSNDRIRDIEGMEIGQVYCTSSIFEDDQHSRAADSETGEFDIRVLFIGKKKSGRTKTLSALMSKTGFINGRVKHGPGFGQWKMSFKGRTFLLSKTPGLISIAQGDMESEKIDVNEVTHPGPHVLLFIIKNPDDDVNILHSYMKLFQDDLQNFLIILFTGKKDLDKRGVAVNTYVQTREGELSRVLSDIKGRYMAVNTDDKDSLPPFKEKLFKLIREVVRVNGSRYLILK